jgi:antitoxin component YwqK of YwqJK toxin-antitoxin module
MNGTNRFLYDEDGNLLNGPRLDGEAYDKDRTKIILRFRNGLLDGDEYDENGKYLGTRPAVEAQEGHLEYWRKGFLHRDGGLAAVVSKGFTYKEYWENGKRIK